ncbi:MAG: hypothetical protein HYT50_01865, partial [Candidatus Wildermuthbacteria bacterium]|nr:hypothetical protein [Candidatus Wildermuthbacteria bacterium]
YSPAVPKTHPERENDIPQQSYPEALGELTRSHYTIAISGTHGKSTTTSMIGLLLVHAGLDPTIIVGTKLKELDPSQSSGSNCRVGKSKYLVIEADEHFASFLNYSPAIAVLTTVEADHLDYYKTLANILKTFKKYILRVPKNGYAVANKDDINTKKILAGYKGDIAFYSPKQKEAARLRKNLKIPGEHNVANALAALAVARILKIPDAKSFSSLLRYQGAWRRFEIFKVKTPKPFGAAQGKPYTLVSDYGHHPTEVRVTVEAARKKWKKEKLWLVFQPHQYLRTHLLWKDFVQVLSHLPVDKLILADIYDVAGREEKNAKQKVSSEKLAKFCNALYIPGAKQIEEYLEKNLTGGEIVMVMGAGDIYNLTIRLTRNS